MNGYQQHGPCVYRAESDGTLTRIGMATDLRRHIRNASRRLNDTGDLDLIVGELARWARDNAPNAGGRRNALAAAEWLKGTAVILAETGPEETGR